MAQIVVFANRKGGSGKTTLAFNVASLLADNGNRCLLVDTDPQAHATVHAGLEPLKITFSVYEALVSFLKNRQTVSDPTLSVNSNFSILPANEELSALELELKDLQNRESVLKDFLLELESEFDYIIIDTPPSLGLITINALVASQYLVIPVKADFLSLVGLSQMMGVYYRVNALLNPELKFLGIVPTIFDVRTRISKEVLNQLRATFGSNRIFTPIRSDVKVMEASGHALPIHKYCPRCRATQDLQTFAVELLRRIGGNG
ncbi:MAG: ParA family protein [Thermotogae bacterium]|nr:ParA family protein [Thermotogota bacterium]